MLKETKEGVLLSVKVIPNASQDAIVGWENDELKLRINAPPEKGKANHAVVRFLSKQLKLSKSQITLVQGETHRHKVFCLSGITVEELLNKLS